MATKCISNLKNCGTLARIYVDSHRNLWPAGSLDDSNHHALPWFVELARAKIMGGPTNPRSNQNWNENREPVTLCPSMPQIPGVWMAEGYGSERAQLPKRTPPEPFYNIDDAGLALSRDGYGPARSDIVPGERVWLIDCGNNHTNRVNGTLRSCAHWFGFAEAGGELANDWVGSPVAIHSGRVNLLSVAGAVTAVQPRELYSWWTANCTDATSSAGARTMRSIPIRTYITPVTGMTLLPTD